MVATLDTTEFEVEYGLSVGNDYDYTERSTRQSRQDVPGVMVERWWSSRPKDEDGSYEYWNSVGFWLLAYFPHPVSGYHYVMVKAR